MGYYDDVCRCAGVLAQRLGGRKPTVALILGSGLGDFAERMDGAMVVGYGELPGFPLSTVPGHAGRFVCSEVRGVEG